MLCSCHHYTSPKGTYIPRTGGKLRVEERRKCASSSPSLLCANTAFLSGEQAFYQQDLPPLVGLFKVVICCVKERYFETGWTILEMYQLVYRIGTPVDMTKSHLFSSSAFCSETKKKKEKEYFSSKQASESNVRPCNTSMQVLPSRHL